MVTIKDYQTVEKDDGNTFFTLLVQGGVEPVRSQRTGKIYFTARTARVPTTFDEETCKSVIGIRFDGEIKKIACEPYKLLIEETGEEIELKHRWEFVDESLELIEKHVMDSTEEIK